MKKRTFFALSFVLFIVVSPCFVHLPHDPFRPREHLVLVPEKDLIRIEEEGEFLEEEVVEPQEEKVEVQQEVVVKVEEIPFWENPYFYIILILSLVTILIWRKIIYGRK